MPKNAKTFILISLAGAVLIGGAVFTVIKYIRPAGQAGYEILNNESPDLLKTGTAPGVSVAGNKAAAPEEIKPGDGFADQGASGTAPAEIVKPAGGEINSNQAAKGEPGFKTYAHPKYGFSFSYPDGWSAEAFQDDGGDGVAVQNQETGIMILIYPFPEPGPISRERILKDVPDLKIKNEIVLKVAGLDALGFETDEREFGPTKEVWFVYNGFLYQISGATGSGAALEKIIASWKFK